MCLLGKDESLASVASEPNLGVWEQGQKRNSLEREERQREHTTQVGNVCTKANQWAGGSVGKLTGWGGERFLWGGWRGRLGRPHRASNGLWTILSLTLWDRWEPRKAVSSRPVLAQLGPAIIPEQLGQGQHGGAEGGGDRWSSRMPRRHCLVMLMLD